MRVVEPSSVFFREFDYKVVDSCHLRYEACQLDVLDHSEVGLTGFFGRPRFSYAPYYHPYISNGGSRAFILLSWGLLLWWICPLLTNKPLQFPLSYKSFYLLLQIVVVDCVMSVIMVEPEVLIP